MAVRSLKARGRPAALALLVCAVLLGGCAHFNPPRIDPTGDRIFAEPLIAAEPNYREVPGPPGARDRTGVVLFPQETVAPVGSEVVMLAGVVGPDSYLMTSERIEWMLEPGGVGQFVDLGKRTTWDFLLWDFTRPRKVDNTFAINSTSRRSLRLTRGTPSLADDVLVQRGQAWITVTSPEEGVSRVTAYGPGVRPWECQRRTATIHWVDAQWSFPPPSINPAGSSHVFITTVTRQSDGAPCQGWRVRYEIQDGPPAGFSPGGTDALEVPTDELGQASAEIFQKQPGAGTNTIVIQVIRPAELGGGKRLVVGCGTTLKTWSAADLAVQKTGPAVATLGATMTYQIEVSNPGDLPADDVVLTDTLPDGTTYLGSNPGAEVVGRSVQWPLGTLAGKETRVVQIDLRADRRGTVTNCAEAGAAEGLQARDCATTTVSAAAIDVQVAGPEQPVRVGQQVTFTIVVTNRGQVPAGGLVIKNRFDPGLEHDVAPSPIERDLGVELAPGQSQRIGVTLRVTGAGRLCNTAEVLADGRVLATNTACVTAVEAAAPQPPPAPPPPEPRPPENGVVSISAKMAGPQACSVGDRVLFTIEVVNTGQRPLTGVRVATSFDPSLGPTRATLGHERERGDIVWNLDSFLPEAKRQFEVECDCLAAVFGASGRVQVTSREGARDEDRLSVQIRPAAAPRLPQLSMTVNDLRDPVAEGKEFTYLIRVVNTGQAPDRQVRVVVTVPPELQVIRFGTHGPPSTDFVVTGQTIRFTPVDTLQPDPERALEYRIRVRAVGAGDVPLRAELSSENLRQPDVVEESTTVFSR